MQILEGPLSVSIPRDNPNSFVVNGPNWHFVTTDVQCINIHVHNDTAPTVKRESQLYTILHVSSMNGIEGPAGDDSNTNMPAMQEPVSSVDDETVLVAAHTTPTPAIQVVAPIAPAVTPTAMQVALVLLLEEHRQLMRTWLADHPAVAWVAPPRKLTADLLFHLLATSNSPSERKNLSRLSPAILTHLADHGHIDAGRKLWMKRLLRNAGEVATREFMPDGDELYAVLVRAHLGHNGCAHIVPSSMRKKLKSAYIFPPGELFYDAWVAACPGCSWPN